MGAKLFLCLILLLSGLTPAVVASYIIRPSQLPQTCDYRVECDGLDNSHLTLSQFVNNLSDYLENDTTLSLIFLPGKYSLESDLIVENVHSFSMYAWPGSSSKVEITCGHKARFEFRNISTVTISGLEFIGCFQNHVITVPRFQFENSGFFGNGRAIVNSTVLRIEESTAYLDWVVFNGMMLSAVDELDYYQLHHCYSIEKIFSNVDRVTGITLRSSNVTISNSRFEGNNVGLISAVIFIESDNNLVIINSSFISNSYCYSASALHDYALNCFYDCYNITNSIVHTTGHGNTVKIYDTKFMQNEGVLILFGENLNVIIARTRLMNNMVYSGFCDAIIRVTDSNLTVSHSTFNYNTGRILIASSTEVSISHSEFLCNNGSLRIIDGVLATIDHSKFINNFSPGYYNYTSLGFSGYITAIANGTEVIYNSGMVSFEGVLTTIIDHSTFIHNTGYSILDVQNVLTTIIDHSTFIHNTAYYILNVGNVNVTTIQIHLNEFIDNNIIPTGWAVVFILYYTTAENLTGNVFINNNAMYEIFISSVCGPNLGSSLGTSPCTPCSDDWYIYLIGIAVASFIAGIALVILMLALNLTVAVGTLNGIFFYANIVVINTDTYFLRSMAPNFVTVFISWLNLDIGFDVCFIKVKTFSSIVGVHELYKALLQLAFPVYVIFLVIVVIVASECSSKFAKIISKGNPVAVLGTMILVSSAKFFNLILVSFTLAYYQPAYGSQNVDIRLVRNSIDSEHLDDTEIESTTYFLLAIDVPIFFLSVIYAALVFSWQWLLRYQDKAIFKWVRYQKLRHFLEPYHAPYTAKYRYWTGLLLFAHILLYLINFSLNPRVDLLATIFIVGGLILLKGVTAKRVYKNWILDVMETAIYFNLVAFSALTWYNLDFGGNQVAVAYTSVMIIFTLLLGVIIFHVFRYTRLYKCSLVEKAFKWTSSKLLEKRPKEQPLNDAPEELDGYRLERSAAGDQELPTITYSVVEINQPAQNQDSDENYTAE